MKRIITIIFILIALAFGVFVLFRLKKEAPEFVPVEEKADFFRTSDPIRKVIGTSVEGRLIEAYTFGEGEKRLLFVGGIHGGYEWNSVILAYQFMDYLGQNPNIIPTSTMVTVIPSANPDGVYKVIGKEGRFSIVDVPTTTVAVGTGRFNTNGVDLNRNFACKWKPQSTWRSNVVSGGSAPFSEPESAAIRDFVLTNKPSAVIFWHSQANAVYASYCESGILAGTLDIMNAYSKASGYPAVKSFDAYEISGDAEGWLASIGIPAITVELKTHETIEWEKNLLGIKALFTYFSKATTTSP